MDDCGTIQRRLARELAKAFEAHGAALLDGLATVQPQPQRPQGRGPWWRQPPRQGIGSMSWPACWKLATLSTAALFLDPITEAVRSALRAGAAAARTELGVSLGFTLAHPQAMTYLEEQERTIYGQIQAELQAQIAALIADGARLRWHRQRLERAIARLHRQAARRHARTIAALIVADAVKAGSTILMKELVR